MFTTELSHFLRTTKFCLDKTKLFFTKKSFLAEPNNPRFSKKKTISVYESIQKCCKYWVRENNFLFLGKPTQKNICPVWTCFVYHCKIFPAYNNCCNKKQFVFSMCSFPLPATKIYLSCTCKTAKIVPKNMGCVKG